MSIKLLKRIYRVDAIACPVPDISACPYMVVSFDGSKYGIRGSIRIGFGVIVNGDLDIICPCKTVYHIPLIFFGL